MIAAAEVPTVVTTMATQARSQSGSRTAYVHLIERRRTDAINAAKEGLRGGRVVEVQTMSGHCEQERDGQSPSLLLGTGST
jgi:hypothetical protein